MTRASNFEGVQDINNNQADLCFDFEHSISNYASRGILEKLFESSVEIKEKDYLSTTLWTLKSVCGCDDLVKKGETTSSSSSSSNAKNNFFRQFQKSLYLLPGAFGLSLMNLMDTSFNPKVIFLMKDEFFNEEIRDVLKNQEERGESMTTNNCEDESNVFEIVLDYVAFLDEMPKLDVLDLEKGEVFALPNKLDMLSNKERIELNKDNEIASLIRTNKHTNMEHTTQRRYCVRGHLACSNVLLIELCEKI